MKIKKEELAQEEGIAYPEAKGLAVIGLVLALFICLLTFQHGNPSANWLGIVGYYVALAIQFMFGLGSYLIALFFGWYGWQLLIAERPKRIGLSLLFFSLFLVSICLLLSVYADLFPPENPLIRSRVFSQSMILKFPYPHRFIRYNLGGVPFYYLFKDVPILNLQHLLSNIGITLTFSMTALVSLVLLTETSIFSIGSFCVRFGKACMKMFRRFFKSLKPKTVVSTYDSNTFSSIERSLSPARKATPLPHVEKQYISYEEDEALEPEINAHEEQEIEILSPQAPEPRYVEELEQTEVETFPMHTDTPKKKKKYDGDFRRYRLPPASLLTPAKAVDQPTLKRDLEKRANILEETLQSFGIEAKVGNINCGPTITSFEVHPPIGVKVQKIKVLENDIALNMQAKSIRIIAPIPGKAAVGVEVPSLQPQEVGFKEMLTAYQRKHKFHIPILLGKTVSGDDVFCDLTKMPHCLIAGATGSGKSVCINTMVLSILMNARPDEVRLLMVDPKKVELSGYTRLPHMIAPVITEARGAYAALQWLVKEMQDRYEILKQMGLRNITAFNERKRNEELEEALGIEIPKKMSYIVAIIDEFADLMMASSSDLETPIARIAQMARAVGIHLVLATQRPSREVITGLIKANFPTRISFKVANRVNSQIILDENGAEALLGNGDMLFLPPGTSTLIRSQGVYVRDEDINKVVDHICAQSGPQYLIKSFDAMSAEDTFGIGGEDPKDELYEKALNIVLDTRTASTTFLQRKLKIGYARAASLIDELEDRGVVGPPDGSKGRAVLKNRQYMDGE